jgi:hypothetical protein
VVGQFGRTAATTPSPGVDERLGVRWMLHLFPAASLISAISFSELKKGHAHA